MQIDITSVSRKAQRAGDVAAAVFVITHDDIRRSGLTSIPDLLRLAPGVDVAQINANKWAVSLRGFNGLRANKLLVLVDGRSVYNRLFSGVLWDEQDVMLDDIDRIEVIRGPGAAIWGANAVNGVINIVTKTSTDTQGGLVRLDGGRAGQQGSVRYGGLVGPTHYRLYAQWTGIEPSLTTAGTGANDAAHAVTTGFRADRTTRPGALMVEGAVTFGRARALWPNLDPQTAARGSVANDPSDAQSGHILSRLTQTRPNGSTLQIQGFVDLAKRQEPVANFDRKAFDVDMQYHATYKRHDVVAGAGYRFIDERFDGHVGFSLTPTGNTASLVTAFVQDEIALFGERLAVTLGSQMQYDSDSGAGVQPTARAIWKAIPRQRVWLAASRALRTPSLADRGIRVDFPPVASSTGLPLLVTALGNPAAETENLVNGEAGYRLEIGARASIDVAAFVGRYDHLHTQEFEAPIVSFNPTPRVLVTGRTGNRLQATTRGVEVAGNWAPVPFWRLDGSYSAFHINPRLETGSLDPAAATMDASAPRQKWHVRSAFSHGSRASFNVALFHVGPLAQLEVNAYTRADVNTEWRFTDRLSVMVIGQNLVDEAHAEFGTADSLLLATEVARSGSVRVRWTFR